MHVGKKIRDLRLRRGLTVQSLATASGLSKGFISQVENDRTSPSLATLGDVARALDVSVAYLVVEEDPVPYVVRASERVRVKTGPGAPRIEVLSAAPRRNLEMLMMELAAGASTDAARHDLHGEQCMLVLEGRVAVACGDHTFVLETGDSIHYDGRVPHTIENLGDGAARLVTSRTPAGTEPQPRVVEPTAGRGPRPAR